MTVIRLHAPEVERSIAVFHWSETPVSGLYLRNRIELRFPDTVDLRPLDPGLFWIAAIAVLHGGWVFLKPCRIEVPVRLPPGAAQVWERLLTSYATTLDFYAHNPGNSHRVEITESGPPLPPPQPLPDIARAATAFSGGKDSTCHAGLLCELSDRPLLVTITSPTPGKEDHLTERRRKVMAEIQARRDVEWIEVLSDLHSGLDNEFPRRAGYPVALNEVCDTSLYFAALLLAGAARGATHLFLASEADVQESIEHQGATIQHPHFMYSNATQRAMEGLVRPYGLRYGSLTGAIHGRNVQELLWTRYPELGELQYSCFRQKRGESVCSACPSCLYHATCVMHLGHHPRRMGIDPVKLFPAMRDWSPRVDGTDDPRSRSVTKVARRVSAYIVRTPLRLVFCILGGGKPARACSDAEREAMRAFLLLRKRCREYGHADVSGFREGFLRYADPLFRDRVHAIISSHFSPEPDPAYRATLHRSDCLAEWLLAPLQNPGI